MSAQKTVRYQQTSVMSPILCQRLLWSSQDFRALIMGFASSALSTVVTRLCYADSQRRRARIGSREAAISSVESFELDH